MEHVFVLYDRATQSVWYPGEQALQAVGGMRKGMSVPFLDEPAPIRLSAWLEQHPESTVLLPSEADYREWQRARLGVGIARAEGGIRITRVAEDSAAEAAGMLADDVIVRIAGTSVTTRDELRAVLSDYTVGDSVEVDLERAGENGETERLTVKVAFVADP